jgi:hypothetical protein
VWVAEPLPMLGQFWFEPEPEPELEFELGPDDGPEEPGLVLPVPGLPEGVLVGGLLVDEPDDELVPELPVVLEVAAAATSAPPATRPVVSAPMANTLRRRICMGGLPFVS